MSPLLEKLKKRWKVESIGGVLLILFLFSITGMSALYVRQFLFQWMGIQKSDPFWIKGVAWFFTVLPSYQLLFLVYGFLLGKFEFVWEWEKKMFRRIKNLFASDIS